MTSDSWVGQFRRFEDGRLLLGKGQYLEDLASIAWQVLVWVGAKADADVAGSPNDARSGRAWS